MKRFSIGVTLKTTFGISQSCCLTFQSEYTNQDQGSRSIANNAGVLFPHSQIQSLNESKSTFLSSDNISDLF